MVELAVVQRFCRPTGSFALISPEVIGVSPSFPLAEICVLNPFAPISPRGRRIVKRPFPVISDSLVGSYDRICTEAPEIACLLSIQPKSREALIRWFV